VAAETPSPTLIQPDLEFVRTLKRSGADTVKKCYQCATCTVTCKLSPDRQPFPRKEMIWAQWGLKDRLLTDPDVWLCEQCNDCSTQCPRGARPGDVLAAVRAQAVQRYAWPTWLGRLVAQPKYFAVLAAVPLLLGLLFSMPPGEKGDFDLLFLKHTGGRFAPFEDFLSHGVLYGVFIPLSVFIVAAVVTGVKRYWSAMSVETGARNANPLCASVLAAFWEVLTHQQLRKCESNKQRYLAHALIFYGFVGLLITTAMVVVGLYAFGWELPWNLDHPVRGFFKILGNVSGLALTAGCVLMVLQRLRGGDDVGKNTYFDWVFLLILGGVGLTGLLVQLTRIVTYGALPYIVYGVHLALVFFLLAYFPHSKFAHLIYHIAAKVHSKVYDRYDERAPSPATTAGAQ